MTTLEAALSAAREAGQWKPEYTAGTWHVEPLQSTLGADIAICAPSNGWVVAVIQHDPDIQTIQDDEDLNGDNVVWHAADRANAQILAASPALHFALATLQAKPNDPRSHRIALDALALVSARRHPKPGYA